MKKDPLVGRTLCFVGSSQRRAHCCGFYAGIIKKVTRGAKRAIKHVVVERPDGSRIRLWPEEWQHPRAHAVYYGVHHPLEALDRRLREKVAS